MKKTLLSLLFASLAGVSSMSAALEIDGTQYEVDTLICKKIGPGVTYYRLRLPDYPLNVNTLTVDLNNPYNKVETTVGQEKLGSTELLVTAAKRQSYDGHKALAGANANFWCTVEQPYASYIKGTPFGGSVRNGVIVTETNMFSDQWDGGAERTGIVSIDSDKKLWIESMSWRGLASSSRWTEKLDIAQVNKMCNDNELVMFNSYYGTTRAFNTTTDNTEVFLTFKEGTSWAVNKDMVAVVKEIKLNSGGNTLGDYDLCLSGTGGYKTYLEQLHVGDEVTINHAWTSYATGDTPNIEQLVAGNAIVLKDGELTERNYDENYNSQVYSRTGYGMSKDGKTLYVFVIDKSTDPVYGTSKGCGTSVMAEIAKQTGAWNLCTMDAGGSAQMFVQDKVVNKTTETNPRAVENGWFIYSIAAEDTEVASLEFADYELKAPIYSSFRPIVYAYDKYGNLISEDLQGVTLSCDPSLGTCEGDIFNAAGVAATGILTATYNGVSVSKQMKVMDAAMQIRVKNLYIDATREYPIEVIATIDGITYYYNPAHLTWTVDDASVVSIDGNGVLRGLKEGTTAFHCSLNDFSDDATVTVEIAPAPIMEQSIADWTFTASGASSFAVADDGTLSFNYTGGRGPSIKMAKDIQLYSLPDRIVFDITSTLPFNSVKADLRTALDATTTYREISAEATTAGQNINVTFTTDELGGNDIAIFPISLHNITFSVSTSATKGENNIKVNSIRAEYDNYSGVESIEIGTGYDVKVYPNPVIDGTMTLFGAEGENVKISIYNNSGSLVFDRVVYLAGGVASVDVSSLASGIYIVKINSGNNYSVKKIIVK